MADEVTGAIDRRYETLRKRASQDANAGAQKQQDMLKRQFARMGGGPSGAHIKQSMLAEDRSQQGLQRAREGIDMQQNQEMQRRMETLEGRKFQTSERKGSQQFQKGMAGEQRSWQSGEREAGQQFASGEREAGQQFASGERIEGQGFQHMMWQKNFDQVIAPKLDLALKQFGLEETAQTANMKLQVAEAIKRGLPGYMSNEPVASAPAAPTGASLNSNTPSGGGGVRNVSGLVAQGNGLFSAPDGSMYKFDIMQGGYVYQGKAPRAT